MDVIREIFEKEYEYLTGRGASLEFINIKKFREKGIRVELQDFKSPIYMKRFAKEFLPNISSLVLLINNGIEQSRKIFGDNLKKEESLKEWRDEIRINRLRKDFYEPYKSSCL